MTTVTQVGTSYNNGFNDLNRLPTLQIGNYATSVSFAGHHVIPTAVFDDLFFLRALQTNNLWDNNSFAQNGIPLPTNGPNGTIVNPETGMPRHAGSHPAYTNWIRDNLSSLEEAYRTQNFGGLTETQWLDANKGQVYGLAGYIKTELMTPNSGFNLIGATDADFLGRTPAIVADSASYKLTSQFGSGFLDATPGTGTAFDIARGMGFLDRASALNFAAQADLIDQLPGMTSTQAQAALLDAKNSGLLSHFSLNSGFTKSALGAMGVAGDFLALYITASNASELAAQGDTTGSVRAWVTWAANWGGSAVGGVVGGIGGSFFGPGGTIGGAIGGGWAGGEIAEGLAGSVFDYGTALIDRLSGSSPPPNISTLNIEVVPGGISWFDNAGHEWQRLVNEGAGLGKLSYFDLTGGLVSQISHNGGVTAVTYQSRFGGSIDALLGDYGNLIGYSERDLQGAVLARGDLVLGPNGQTAVTEFNWNSGVDWFSTAKTITGDNQITTADIIYKNGNQTTTNYDTTNSHAWDFNTTNRVSGGTVTTTSLDNGTRVTSVTSTSGTFDMNGDGVVNADDADIISGSEGQDILQGNGAGDQLNADGSKTRTVVTGYNPNITTGAGYTFDDMVSNLGKIKLFGVDKVDTSKPIITGSQIGAIFGSNIGKFIAGDNVFAQIGAGSALATAMTVVGAQFDAFFGFGSGDLNAFDAVKNTFATSQEIGINFAQNVHNAGVGALTSFLTAELAEGLGVNTDNFGGALFTYAASQGVNKLLDFALANVGEGLQFTTDIGGALFGTIDKVVSAEIFTPGGIGAFVGTYLAKQIVDVENVGGAIGQSIGSAVGSVVGIGLAATASLSLGPLALVAIPLLFAFGGTALGTIIGNLVGDLLGNGNDDCEHSFILWNGGSTLSVNKNRSDQWIDFQVFQDIRNQAKNTINAIVQATGGNLFGTRGDYFEVTIYAKPNRSSAATVFIDQVTGGVLTRIESFASSNPNALLDYAVIRTLKLTQIKNGDPRVVSTIKESNATTIGKLTLQVTWAQNYNAIEDTLEGFTSNAVKFTRTNFNSVAVGTAGDAAWRAARSMASEMTTANKNLIGDYVLNALQTTLATDTRLVLSQLVVAKAFGNIVDTVKDFAGGAWSGVNMPDFDAYDSLKGSTESNAAYLDRLMKSATIAALTELRNSNLGGAGADLYVIAAVKSTTAQGQANPIQIFMNQLQVAKVVSERLKGIATAITSDNFDYPHHLKKSWCYVNIDDDCEYS